MTTAAGVMNAEVRAATRREAAEVVAIMRMGDANGYHHLEALVRSEAVEHLHIVRPVPEPEERSLESSTYVHAGGGNLLTALWRLYRAALERCRRPAVGALISFNPIPYGLIALLVGWRTRKPVHLGFVGSDWYRHGRSWYGGLLHPLLRRAALVTVTGKTMKAEMVRRGYPADRISVLPHAVDVERYPAPAAGERTYDCLFVGSLIRLKNVDVVLEAVARVRDRRPNVRLAIVGDGPERPALERLAERLGLDGNVVFAGHQSRPEGWFADARTLLIASQREGLPFVLVEAWCAGSVPIATPVGTIPDQLEDGIDGVLVPVGDPDALARAIERLLSDEELYERLRRRALERRDEFRLDRAAALWTDRLSALWTREVAA